MRDVGKSTLLGRRLTYVGFCFNTHPLDQGMKVQTVIYRLGKDSYVLCLSEIAYPDEKEALDSLGAEVDGAYVAPFAARRVDGITYGELKSLLQKAEPAVEYHWLEDIEVAE